jgi:hypothetical protein
LLHACGGAFAAQVVALGALERPEELPALGRRDASLAEIASGQECAEPELVA